MIYALKHEDFFCDGGEHQTSYVWMVQRLGTQ